MLQEAQETSLTVHAALCKEATATTSKLTVSRSDSPSSSQPASSPDVATPVRSPVVRDDNVIDCDDTDILRLARIQGTYHPVNPLREISAPSSTNSVLSQSSYASVIRWKREENQTVQNRRTNVNVRNRTTPAMHDMVVLKPRHIGNVSDGTRRRSDFRTAPNYRRDNRDKRRKKDDVITGSGQNFSLQGSFPQGRAKYRECVGVFVSRLHKDTCVRHVERHILNVTGLHVKCEPIPTKYGTYVSYCIRCSTENTKQLSDSEMWPYNVIVKQYFKVIN